MDKMELQDVKVQKERKVNTEQLDTLTTKPYCSGTHASITKSTVSC